MVGPAKGMKGEATLLATADPYQARAAMHSAPSSPPLLKLNNTIPTSLFFSFSQASASPALLLPPPPPPAAAPSSRRRGPIEERHTSCHHGGSLALLRRLYPSIPTRALPDAACSADASSSSSSAAAVDPASIFAKPPKEQEPPPQLPQEQQEQWHDGRWSAPLAEARRFLSLRLGRLPFAAGEAETEVEAEAETGGASPGDGKRRRRRPSAVAHGGGGGGGGRVEARRFVSEGRELAWLAEAVARDAKKGACVRVCACVF